MRNIELLAPANNIETLKIACIFGADAVYIGGANFGLRAAAKNFTDEELKEAINYAHSLNKKVFITINIYANNSDIDGIKDYLNNLNNIKPDAVIISDLGVFKLAKNILKDIELHISTQANTTNYEAFNFYYELGASRVVAARELSLNELKEIREKIPNNKKIEAFIHGSMCISYSGRCLLSSYFTHKSANKGLCTHPCRWNYYLVEETRPNEYMPIYEDERGTYIFNSKDLCMINHIDDMINSGIDSFKIEGRMKNALYVATVVKAYRNAIDDYLKDPKIYNNNKDNYMKYIKNCTYREFTTGFYYQKPDEFSQIYDNNTYSKGKTFLGIIYHDENGYYIYQKNKFSVNDEVEILTFDKIINNKIIDMFDENNNHIDACPRPNEKIYIKFENDNEINDYNILMMNV